MKASAPPSPVVADSERTAPILFLDLLGTTIHHKTGRTLPILPFLVRRLSEKGWRVIILTSSGEDVAREFARRAGIPSGLEVCSTQNRGQMVGNILRSAPRTPRAYYIDDNPAGLRSATHVDIECLKGRILGFTGSRKYCVPGGRGQEIAPWCQQHGVPLALSPYDILCRLGECEILDDYVEERPDLTADDLALLVPGLVHPFSWIGGFARAIGELLMRHRGDWNPVWRNLGWIGCSECQCKVMVRSALLSLGMDAALTLGNAYKAHEYVDALMRLSPADRDKVSARLKEIRLLMNDGLRQVGPAAEDCRPPHAEDDWERNRMERLDREFLSILDDDE